MAPTMTTSAPHRRDPRRRQRRRRPYSSLSAASSSAAATTLAVVIVILSALLAAGGLDGLGGGGGGRTSPNGGEWNNGLLLAAAAAAAFAPSPGASTTTKTTTTGGRSSGHRHLLASSFRSAAVASIRTKKPLGIMSSATEEAATDAQAKSPSKTKKKGGWFPVRPSDALPKGSGGEGYDAVVRGAYLRHVALETEGAADLALETYLRGGGAAAGGSGSSGAGSRPGGEGEVEAGGTTRGGDPFGALARDLSACPLSRDEGGKVGWTDNPSYAGPYTSSTDGSSVSSLNEAIHPMISPDVIRALFASRPKGGDVLKLRSDETGLWHLVRVDDLLVDYVSDTAAEKRDAEKDAEASAAEVGSQTGTNRVITAAQRGKLKGSGTTPLSPKFVIHDSKAAEDAEDLDDDDLVLAQTYHISTTGCQMNVADSERLAGVLRNSLRLSEAEKASDADVVVLNTCTIRDHAEQKVYDALGPHAARKRRGERVSIVVAGCVAQQEGEKLLRRVPEVDLVMGPQYTARLGDLLEGVGRGHQIVATDPSLISEDMSRPVRGHDVRAWVNVIHGCNEHCTYCVVPGVRGVEQSRSMEAILEECLGLAEAGYKEVTLLGQNIDAYGRDMIPRRTFADLLHYLNTNVPNGTIERIRYVTSHPRYFSDRVIDAVAQLDKVCECFHMPFQSGDDGVLKNMRRGYTFDSYMRIIHKIRDRAPDASICGDVIVGFPGETDDAFQRTLDLMTAVKFDNLNTFAYSPRPNTEAALWDDQVPDDVKAERLQIVQRTAAEHALERSERYVGRADVEVLVEDKNPRDVGQVMGRTRQGRQVFFDGEYEELRGKLVEVKIEGARPWSLEGRMTK